MKRSFLLLTLMAALLALAFSGQNAYAEGAVAGLVYDADGEPVAGAQVVLHQMVNDRRQRPFMAQAESGEDGAFGFRGVPAGRYDIMAMARGLGEGHAQIAVVDDEVTRVRLQLQGRGGGDEERGAGTVSVIVVDADDNAVEGAQVHLTPMRRPDERRGQEHPPRAMRGETNAQGVLVFQEVPAGHWMAVAMARGVGAAREAFDVDADGAVRVRLVLQANNRGGDDQERPRHRRGGDHRD